AASTTVDGGGLDRVFSVDTGALVTISGVTITGGHASDGGPGGPGVAVAGAGQTSAGGFGNSGAKPVDIVRDRRQQPTQLKQLSDPPPPLRRRLHPRQRRLH